MAFSISIPCFVFVLLLNTIKSERLEKRDGTSGELGVSSENFYQTLHRLDDHGPVHWPPNQPMINLTWFQYIYPSMQDASAVAQFRGQQTVDAICLESIPATGKSTLLRHMQDRGHIVILEPMEELFANYTPRVYGNLSRWAFTFHVEYMDWMQKVKDVVPFLRFKHPDKLIFVERSPRTQANIFLKYFEKQNLLSSWELDLLQRMWDRMSWQPTHYLYLRISPETAIQRIEKRSRPGEVVDKIFLKDLNDLHDQEYGGPQRVVRVDAGQTPDEVVASVITELKKVGIKV